MAVFTLTVFTHYGLGRLVKLYESMGFTQVSKAVEADGVIRVSFTEKN